MGLAPINATIARGSLETFTWLLKHGANPNHVNSSFSGHAIHLCCHHDESIEFAKELLRLYPRYLNLQSAWGYTPLHHAALHGHTVLAKLLVQKGANLSAHSGGRATRVGTVTPLGAAIVARSIPMVKFMCEKLMEQKRPLHAYAFWGLRKDALQYLLRPGEAFQTSDHSSDGWASPWDRGCYDHPFSKASKEILDYLLSEKILDHLLERPKSHLAIGQRMKSWLRSQYTIGNSRKDSMRWAVRISNHYAIKSLSDCEYYQGDYRDLLAVAYRQLLVGSTHIARDEEISSMIEGLRDKQISHHETWLQRHDPKKVRYNPLSRIFVTYMRKYVIVEQEQYQKALDWMSENRLSSAPAMLEHRGDDIWFPGYRARFALIWILLIPAIVGLIISWLDRDAHYTASNRRAAVFMFILVS